jgi:pilus assembly protein CpaE
VGQPAAIPEPLFSTQAWIASAADAAPLRVAVIDPDDACRARAREAFARVDGIGAVYEAARIEDGIHEVLTARPDVILVGLDEPRDALALTAKLLAIYPETLILIAADASSSDHVKQAMRIGAREYLTRRPDPEEIRAAIRRLQRQRAHSTPAPHPAGTIVAVFAAKGGLGTTFVATNLAILLAATGHRAAIVDLNTDLGDVDTFLNLKATRSIHAIASADAESADPDQLLDEALSRHRSGLRMLAQPVDAGADRIDPGDVGRVLSRLRARFDFVVVDVARRFDERTLEALDLADHILFLTTLDLPTIRNTRRAIEIFTRLGHLTKLKLVLNRHRPAQVAARLERAFGLPVFWHLPEDAVTAVSAVNAGVPATEVGPETDLAASLRGLAAAIEEIPGALPAAAGRQSGLLKRLLMSS